MELLKLLDQIQEMVNADLIDGESLPDLDRCHDELNELIQGYAARHVDREMVKLGYKKLS